jgi:hypothetical protein
MLAFAGWFKSEIADTVSIDTLTVEIINYSFAKIETLN